MKPNTSVTPPGHPDPLEPPRKADPLSIDPPGEGSAMRPALFFVQPGALGARVERNSP